jgi:methylase of polypeptide subunit release factors
LLLSLEKEGINIACWDKKSDVPGPSDFQSIIMECLDRAKQANSHPAKLIVLTDLLKKLFGVELIEIIPGIERRLGSKIYGFRGRADLLFRLVVFEIKVDLEKELEDAKNQLKKYFQALFENNPIEKFIGIATDVIHFKAYVPVIEGGKVVDVLEIGSITLSQVNVEEGILWLDSFIFHEQKIRPTADDLRFRFGPGSPTYAIATYTLKRLWDVVKDEASVKLKLDLWMKNMEIVYGSTPKEEAFIDQTYLVTLVKLIVYYRLSGESTVEKCQIRRALTGEYFQSYGILNLIEEDFFTWILHPNINDQALDLVRDMANELLKYDMSQIDEDLFKEIYQEIVKRSDRHRIGEYYTPEWLAQLTLKEALNVWFDRNKEKDAPRILDPACGSGTFLCNAVYMLKNILCEKGKQPYEILDFILNNVVGIDINPLAVIIARANYLISLGELLRVGKQIVIPVYVSDSIRLPEIDTVLSKITGEPVPIYQVLINEKDRFQIPSKIVEDRYNLGLIINVLRETLNAYRENSKRDDAENLFRRRVSVIVNEAELDILNTTLNVLLDLVDRRKNEIWIFILNNTYAPIVLKEAKFDMLISNPPWISMRYIENENYQNWLKQNTFKYGLLSSSQVHLFTQMEIATLFFNRCVDLYLAENGVIAFVMPRSILTGALHHNKFKEFDKPRLKLLKILDCEDVEPLFNVPSCVLLARKGEKTEYPVNATRLSGKISRKNIHLEEANKVLKRNDYPYSPPRVEGKVSFYYDKVKAGAAIYPRCFYFIEFDIHPKLGVTNIQIPYVKTSEEIDEKEPWKNIRLRRNVEADFIYVTLLGGDIVSFGYIKLRSIVMPVIISGNSYKLLDNQQLRSLGYVGVASWFEEAQRIWDERATEKSRKNFPRLIDAINYHELLTAQKPNSRFIVLYNAAGTNIVSCVIDKYRLPQLNIGSVSFQPKGFIADKKTMYYETNDENEAHYLCSVLNSETINKNIKPLQTKGLFGERDIVRRPFMIPIPQFKCTNPIHDRLAELSKICHERVLKISFTKRSVAGRRNKARAAIKDKLEEINELVSKLLQDR